MAVFKSFTFDDVKSSDHGVYITGEAVYDAPARAVEMVTVPGRNGSLALDQGRFENIEVTYPAGMFDDTASDFQSRLAAFRNILTSRYTYKKLIDEYNPDEFRMGLYRSGLDVSPKQLRAGQFDIKFECKPQRFLTSGEQAKTIGLWGATQTESGSMITLENNDGIGFKDFDVAVDPVQNLNGYEKPWMGGCGKNLLNNTATSEEINGITWTVNADGSVTANGTAASESQKPITLDTNTLYGDVYFNGTIGGSSATYDCFMWDRTANARCKQWDGTTASTFGYDETLQQVKVIQNNTVVLVLRIRSGQTVSNLTFYPMICASTETDPTWQPYENICPISGYELRKNRNRCTLHRFCKPLGHLLVYNVYTFYILSQKNKIAILF